MDELTDRQREIKARLDAGLGAKEIADDLGITRNAVYQQIQRLRRYGVLEPGWTPSGAPPRETQAPGAAVLMRLLEDSSQQDGNTDEVSVAGALALVAELRRVRDDCNMIVRRINAIIP